MDVLQSGQTVAMWIIDASFPEIPNIPEYFHTQEASQIFRVFTSFQNKRKQPQRK